MKKSTLLRSIILVGFIFCSGMMAFPRDQSAANTANVVKLFDLKKRGSCDSTKYTISNIDANPIITQHSISNTDGIEEYHFESSIGQGETKTYDLFDMDLPLHGFVGDVIVQGTGEITGEKMPFPPCQITIDGPDSSDIEIDTPYTFIATVSPEDVLLPLSILWYQWNPGKADWEIIGVGEIVELSWKSKGYHEIHIIAVNAVGSMQGGFFVYVNEKFDIYFCLPLLLR